ncbi:MAG: hypothetical protein AADX96_24770 [Thiocapsa sp. C3-sup]|uniref:hypothetical protein n=2 Tax=Thiocapsa TaxID=1056 RepID=UPI0035B17449
MVTCHRPTAQRCLRSILLSSAFTAVLTLGPSIAGEQGLEVEYDMAEGSISLYADDTPLDEVLDAIGESTGIEIVRSRRFATPVRIDLSDVPIRAALDEVLAGYNHTLALDPQSGRPLKLWLMSTADPAVLERARRPPPSPVIVDEDAPPPDDQNEIARQLREEILALGEGESEVDILGKLGLNAEELEELLHLIDEMEDGTLDQGNGH